MCFRVFAFLKQLESENSEWQCQQEVPVKPAWSRWDASLLKPGNQFATFCFYRRLYNDHAISYLAALLKPYPAVMVAISPPAKVLVTSANDYFATWVLNKYLEAGYSVRGTVRSLSKSAFLVDKFAHYGDRFELVVVEDVTKDGAFDEAVKDVDAIAYTASPFHHHKSTNPEGMPYFLRVLTMFGAQDTHTDLIIPAVRGTTSILNSALRHGNTLKRLILTSSIATVREDTTAPHTFTESNWNDSAVQRVKTKGSAAGPATIHMASKTLIEKVAWKFIAAHRSEISWDLVVINPPLVFGASFFFPRFSP